MIDDVLIDSPAHGAEGGSAAVQHSRAELWSV